MSIESTKDLCRKYANATEYFDGLVEHEFLPMDFLTKKFVNQIAIEILEELEKNET